VPADKDPKLEISKTADPMTYDAVGDVITYTVTLKNTGNVTIENAKITDDKTGLTNVAYKHVAVDATESGATNGSATLLPGEALKMTASYTVTQEDVDAGKVSNSAAGSGYAPNPADPENPMLIEPEGPGEVDVPATQTPGMTVSKRLVSINGDEGTTEYTTVGDVLAYEVVVENTGNVTITNVEIEDSLVDPMTATPTESKAQDNKLEVGETWTYAYTYTVTQDDMDAGSVKNTANATGDAPNPDDPTDPIPVEPEEPGTEEVLADRTPRMTVVKRANKTKFKAVGDVIRYTVVVTNTGNVTLTDVKITDTLVDLNAVVVTFTGDVNINGELDVGETWTYTYNYVVKRSDLNAGRVPNTVSVLCKGLSDPLTDKVTIPAERLPDRMDDPASGITTINVGDCYE
jgi:uncharacterized repeat protein (TIGR01451 family)